MTTLHPNNSPRSSTALRVLSVALLLCAALAIWLSLKDRRPEHEAVKLTPSSAEPLLGLITMDVDPFFRDERVRRILELHRLPVQLTRANDRAMTQQLREGQAPEFIFTSGALAAREVTDTLREAQVSASTSSPFYTPVVVASWKPIADILIANGIAQPLGETSYGLDMNRLAQVMLSGKRWRDLLDAGGYDMSRSVLVSTTDLRHSNAAALYLALTSQTLHGDVISTRAQGRDLARRVAPLFTRQGYQENDTSSNFTDYLTLGIGKTPLAFIYENQLIHHALKQDPQTNADRGVQHPVLLYPQPTIINKLVFVATSERAQRLADLLVHDPELQRLAVQHGFRGADLGAFLMTAQPTRLAVEPLLTYLTDAPASEILADMISVVTQEMAQ